MAGPQRRSAAHLLRRAGTRAPRHPRPAGRGGRRRDLYAESAGRWEGGVRPRRARRGGIVRGGWSVNTNVNDFCHNVEDKHSSSYLPLIFVRIVVDQRGGVF